VRYQTALHSDFWQGRLIATLLGLRKIITLVNELAASRAILQSHQLKESELRRPLGSTG
jgi:hypothetical protein